MLRSSGYHTSLRTSTVIQPHSWPRATSDTLKPVIFRATHYGEEENITFPFLCNTKQCRNITKVRWQIIYVKIIRISHAKFHCNRLTTVQDIQDYASLIFGKQYSAPQQLWVYFAQFSRYDHGPDNRRLYDGRRTDVGKYCIFDSLRLASSNRYEINLSSAHCRCSHV